MNTVFIASDHAGLHLKNSIVAYLGDKGIPCEDMGTDTSNSCNYPVYAHKVAHKVIETKNKGILICGTGIGMSITANRTAGIRAALCTCEFHARASRQHNDANILCLGERVTGIGVALNLVDIFLATEFEGGRHQTRINMIDMIEE